MSKLPDPPYSGQPESAAAEMYAARLEAALACLGRIAAQLRWLANDGTLPRKVRYSLWAMALDADDVLAGEDSTVALPSDDDVVDLNVPGRGAPPF